MTNASDVKPVLFVVSSNTVKGATGIPTGYNLAEVTHPLEKLQEAGIRVEFASPKGGDAPLDGLEDMNDPVIAHYWADPAFRHAISHTLPMDQVDPVRYSAIVFAGGHGTMWDFPDNAAIQRAIRDIDAAGGIVWGVVVVVVGYLAGLSYDRAAAWLGGGATAVVAVIVIGALIVWHVRRRQREKALEHEPAGA